MANFLKVRCLKIFYMLVPPMHLSRLPICPVPDFEFGQLDSQVHDGNCNDFRLPLKAQSGAQTVVDKSPGHLHHFLQLLLVTFETFCESDD